MDTSKDICTFYTLRRLEDEYGNTLIETSLRGLMWNCVNFIEEETLLQTNDREIGQRRGHIIVNHTPKCHP